MIAAAMPYSATTRARKMSARPRTAISQRLVRRLGLLVLGELRRALGDERVLLAHEGAGLVLLDGHDDLAALAERVGHAADVLDRDARPALALLHLEGVD